MVIEYYDKTRDFRKREKNDTLIENIRNDARNFHRVFPFFVT